MLFQENETRNSTIRTGIQKMLLAKLDNNKENITPQKYQKQKLEIQNRMENQNYRRN